MEKIFNIIYRFFLTIIILILTGIIYLNVVNKFFPTKHYTLFGYDYMQIISDSMNPIIYKNDYILIKRTGEYKVGDVVTYYTTIDGKGIYITHRITTKNETSIITKGDNNGVSDDPITENMILGKVVKISTFINNASSLVKEIPFLLSIFVTFASAGGLYYYYTSSEWDLDIIEEDNQL